MAVERRRQRTCTVLGCTCLHIAGSFATGESTAGDDPVSPGAAQGDDSRALTSQGSSAENSSSVSCPPAVDNTNICSMYAVEGEVCGESTLKCIWIKNAKRFEPSLEEGDCCTVGFTVPEGATETRSYPFIGDVTIQRFLRSGTQEVVELQTTVGGLEYASLEADLTLRDEVVDIVRAAVVSSSDLAVNAADVHVALSAGSVMVVASAPYADATAANALGSFDGDAFKAAVEEGLRGATAVAEASTGLLACSPVSKRLTMRSPILPTSTSTRTTTAASSTTSGPAGADDRGTQSLQVWHYSCKLPESEKI
eukprot:TRINITY_DN21003_c0_g1_i3.p1 TRINITY_DN21003_c0_g1~~TRINITY_DN21003_c0_g1_i3.p1  ORF type:complete len:327 (-),score=33.03 TRINITY_DN21003_c0_g1_i3:244-1173(-)